MNSQIAEANIASPDRFVDDNIAADLLGLSRSYLRQLRVSGGGPRFSAFGRAVRYRLSDLFGWASSKSVASTSERHARSVSDAVLVR